MSITNFYHLYSSGLAPCSMVKNAYLSARLTWLCVGCAHPKPETKAVDIHIQENRPPEKPLTFVSGCGVPIIHRDLLVSLGESIVQTDLYLGKIYGGNGKLLDDWVTFRGRNRVIIRGSKNISYRKCTDCGRDIYFALGSRYLFPAPIADRSISESDLFGLLVTPSVMACVPKKRWRNLTIEEVQVLSNPKDGFPKLK